MVVSSPVTARPGEARRELVRPELGRRRLVDFCEYVSPWYRAFRHHRLVAGYLEEVERFIRTKGREGIGRLLIFEPPRHGKSEQASRQFPAWVLGRNPDCRVILASYGADLATGNSRAVRELVMSERFAAVFGSKAAAAAPVELSSDSRSVEAWDLAAPARGGVVATGVGGGITGKGAHLLVIDDPFKNRDEAESESHRRRVWDWWTSSAITRLEDGAAVIGMLTRWHGDDWAGRLLRAMASDPLADQYEVVNLPAIWEAPEAVEGQDWEQVQRSKMLEGIWVGNEDLLGREVGEALWPEKYDAAELRKKRANVGEYDWAALYQQTPYLRNGSFFQREWFQVVDVGPLAEKVAGRVRYWDKAGSRGGDFSAGVLMSCTVDGWYYVEHVERGQWSPGTREERILATAKEDALREGPQVTTWHPQDPGSAGLDSAQATNEKLATAGLTAHFEPVTGSKEVRAGPWSTMCEAGKVRLVRGGWNEAFIEEHLAFPRGRHDDQVDAASGAFSKLSTVSWLIT